MTTEKATALDPRWARIIPVVFILYSIAIFDRINFGLAIPSLSKDMHLTPAQSGLAGGIFFWGYLVTFLAAGWLAPRVGAKRMVLGSLVLWGACAIGTGFVRSYTELLVMRVLLGAAEGPVWTTISMFLSEWFVSRERARAFGLWNLCNPVGAMLAGPISGLILTYSNWHLMFALEGFPAWIWAAVWWFTIPERPAQADWLPEAERKNLAEQLATEQAELMRRPKSDWLGILRERNVWLLLGAFSLAIMVNYGFTLWLPSVIKAASGLHIGSTGLLAALPYVASIFGLLAITYNSDRMRERRLHAGIPMIVVGVFLWIGSHFGAHSIVIEMAAFIVMGFFFYPFLPLIFSFLTELLPQNMAIPAIAFVGGIGNLFGGFLGPLLVGWMKQSTGSFAAPFGLLAAFGIIGGVLILMVRVSPAAPVLPAPMIRFRSRQSNDHSQNPRNNS